MVVWKLIVTLSGLAALASICNGAYFVNNDWLVNLNVGSSVQIASTGFPNQNYTAGTSSRYTVVAPGEYNVQAVCTIKMQGPFPACYYERFYVGEDGDPDINNADFYCGSTTVSYKSTGSTIMLAYISTYYTGQWNCTLTPVCDCGWNLNSKIVGGTNATQNQFTPMAALYNPNNYRHYCGASIVSKNYVVTAAHCLSLYTITDMQVGVGVLKTGVTIPNETKYYNISTSVIHPNYVKGQNYYDVALVQTKVSIVYSTVIASVCLPFFYPTFDFSSFYVQAAGYGTTSYGGQFSGILQSVSLLVQTNAQCSAKFNGTIIVDDSQLCTYGGINKDSCQFDSGGPLFYRSSDTRLFSLGIISFGEGCGLDKPAVNSRMTWFQTWIESVTGPLCRRGIT